METDYLWESVARGRYRSWLRSPRTNSTNPDWRAGIVICSDGVINQNGNNVTNTNGVRRFTWIPETGSKQNSQSKVKELISVPVRTGKTHVDGRKMRSYLFFSFSLRRCRSTEDERDICEI